MSYQYAVVSDDEQSVVEFRSYPEPLAADQIKKLPNGRLKVRPVVMSLSPVLKYQVEQIIDTIEPTQVVRTNVVTDSPDKARKIALDQIAVLEAAITNRRIREATLTQDGKDWLAAKDAEIAALRASI